MEEIARIIYPDKIVFSSMDCKPSSTVKKYIADLQGNLNYLNIKVEWFPLNEYIFEADPF